MAFYGVIGDENLDIAELGGAASHPRISDQLREIRSIAMKPGLITPKYASLSSENHSVVIDNHYGFWLYLNLLLHHLHQRIKGFVNGHLHGVLFAKGYHIAVDRIYLCLPPL